MVGLALNDPPSTPRANLELIFDQKVHLSDPANSSRVSPVFYATISSASTPGLEASSSGSSRGLEAGPDFMPGDASGDMPDLLPTSDQGRPGFNRRRSHSQSTSSRRPPGSHPLQTPSTIGYVLSPPPNPTENIHNVPSPPSFQGPSPNYPAPSVPYNQRTGYVGQYTMSTQPPLSIGHTPPPFSYSHAFHHPGVPDSTMVAQNIHASYQPMLQPHAPVYQYQAHSPEGGSASHPPFSGSGASSIYSHHQVNQSPAPLSSPSQSSAGQSSAHSPSYVGTGQFHSLRFTPPMSTPQYAYPPQSFPASPMYPPQYAPAPFPQHFPSTSEADGQGTWWYLPHAAPVPSQQYDTGQPSYHSHYSMSYSPLGRRDVDTSYAQPSTSSSSGTTALYPMSPTRPAANFSADQLPSPSSPSSGAAGIGSPKQENSVPPTSGRIINDKPVVRRPYHPNPPTHRSEWVMWAGNVPSDATHDELWRFFSHPPEHNPQDDVELTGVLSIFLISRSSCAFVNFETDSHLHAAIARFNGQPLRPTDPRCPRLVCRVRRKDDDLKAGVGGQRGMGMHTRWIKDQKGKSRDSSDPFDPSTSDDPPTTPSSSSDQLVPVMSLLSLSSDEEGRQSSGVKGRHSSSSGSYASTNSSILTRYFPKRYFILKSLTRFDLDLSVEEGLWATQKHNEGILDQAYRTSTDVYLIFGVNKSGEFYGYARMAGPVQQGEHRVSWATRTTDSSPSSRSSLSPITGRGPVQADTIPEEPLSPSRSPRQKKPKDNFFTPAERRLVDNSPLPAATPEMQSPSALTADGAIAADGTRKFQSAPAELGQPHRKLTPQTPSVIYSQQRAAPPLLSNSSQDHAVGIELDHNTPIRALRSNQGSVDSTKKVEQGGSKGASTHVVAEEGRMEDTGDDFPEIEGEGREADGEAREETWGESFKIQWICTERLPFHRTRHIRNPWNHDREVKVSRDGTELEPSVGQKLLDEWEHLSEPLPSPLRAVGRHPPTSRRVEVSSK